MCTFKDERSVLVCDVAIGRVRERLGVVLPEGVQYTVVDGQGTLVEADPRVSAERFVEATRRAISAVREAG